VSKARKGLGWIPKITLEDHLIELIAERNIAHVDNAN
jgi:hypothetical protein